LGTGTFRLWGPIYRRPCCNGPGRDGILQIEVNRGLPAALLVKYFKREGLEWQLKDEIRRMVRFEQDDLRRTTSTRGPFDLVFCRNVLILLRRGNQAKHHRPNPAVSGAGGPLVIGWE